MGTTVGPAIGAGGGNHVPGPSRTPLGTGAQQRERAAQLPTAGEQAFGKGHRAQAGQRCGNGTVGQRVLEACEATHTA